MLLLKLLPIALLCVSLQSQPLSPTPPIKRGQPKQLPTGATDQPNGNNRGTEQSPVFVKVLPPEKTHDESANDKTKALGFDNSSAEWWMVRLTAAIAIIGLIQTIVFGIQAHRQKQTISKMDEIATSQTRDVQASIAEATRAATAMENVATSMAESAESVRTSVAINREIADTQKLVTELQSRAYLVAIFAAMTPQNDTTNIRFQPHIQIENRGNTPAYDVRFSISADVAAFPLRDEFTFALPPQPLGHSSAIGPGLHKLISGVVPKIYPKVEADQVCMGVGQRVIAWGIVKYRDAFKIERSLKFGFTFYQIGASWMSMDTERHNDAD